MRLVSPRTALVVVGVVATVTVSACSSLPAEPPSQLCFEVAEAEDLPALGRVIDDVAPGHDTNRNERTAERAVNRSCPDQAPTLRRFREQVLTRAPAVH